MTKGIILAEDVEFLFLLPDLAIIIGHSRGRSARWNKWHEGIAGEISGILRSSARQRHSWTMILYLLADFIDDFHHIAAVGAP